MLSSGVRSSESITWAAVLQSEHILCRILWIAENTLNPQLVEKVSIIIYALFAYVDISFSILCAYACTCKR